MSLSCDAMPRDDDRARMPGCYTKQLYARVGSLDEGSVPESLSLEEQQAVLIRLQRSQPPGWALAAGTALSAAAHGAVGIAAVTAPTVGQGLEVLASYGSARTPICRLSLSRSEKVATLGFVFSGEFPPELLVPLAEMTAVSVAGLLDTMAGPVSGLAASFTHPAPPYADRYRHYLDGAVQFSANRTAISLPRAALDRPSLTADLEVHTSSVNAAARDSRPPSTVSDVRRLLAQSGARPPDHETVARHLHVSPRSLTRRLAEAGTSFETLVDAHKQEHAVRLLACSQLSIGHVADALGYHDAANFGRACHRWFGNSPGSIRKSLQGAALAV